MPRNHDTRKGAQPKDTDTDLQDQVDRNSVPFLNTEKNTGEVDESELGESNQRDLGFDEPAVLGVNAIVDDDGGEDGEQTDIVTDAAVITDEDDPQPRDNLNIVTNGDGTLLRAEAV